MDAEAAKYIGAGLATLGMIGAGVGGLASALLLAHSGKKVALFEKRFTPGGRIGSTKRDDFTVDFGVHLISRGQNGPL